jgi:PIN domain nuclease of toxin-antitoxin system
VGPVKVLLDTHVLLWWLVDDPRLPAGPRSILAEPDNTLLVSSASAWEIATKHRLGKLPEAGEIVRDFENLLRRAQMSTLPISVAHALKAGSLPGHHRDPFDRLLIAQSLLEGVPIMTRDPAFEPYKVELLW